MGKIRRNALNYSVKDYAEILLENLDTISDTKEKFQKYRELLRTLNKIVRMESFQDDFTGNRWNRCWSFPMMQCVS